MREAEAFCAMWYRCPNCDTENTVRINSPYFPKGFSCRGCKTVWTTDGLYKAFGTIFPPQDKMNALCVEFLCECGRINLIFSKVIEQRNEVLDEGWNKHVESAESPTFGICEECGAFYDLIYPTSESMEQWLEDNEDRL